MEFTLPGLSHREAKHLSVSHPAGSRARGHPPKRPKRSRGTCPLLQPWHSRATPSPEVFCQHRAPGKGAAGNKALPRAPFPKERPWSSTWNISRGEQTLIFQRLQGNSCIDLLLPSVLGGAGQGPLLTQVLLGTTTCSSCKSGTPGSAASLRSCSGYPGKSEKSPSARLREDGPGEGRPGQGAAPVHCGDQCWFYTSFMDILLVQTGKGGCRKKLSGISHLVLGRAGQGAEGKRGEARKGILGGIQPFPEHILMWSQEQ